MNHQHIQTTFRESALYEAGASAGRSQARQELAEQLTQLAVQVKAVSPDALVAALGALAEFLKQAAPELKPKKRAVALAYAAGLPASAESVSAARASLVNVLEQTAAGLAQSAAEGREEFARRLAELGGNGSVDDSRRAATAPPPARPLFVRILKRVAEAL